MHTRKYTYILKLYALVAHLRENRHVTYVGRYSKILCESIVYTVCVCARKCIDVLCMYGMYVCIYEENVVRVRSKCALCNICI